MLKVSDVINKLRAIPGEKQFLENCEFQSNGKKHTADLVMIHEAGVFLFTLFPEPGLFSGSELHYSWKFTPAGGKELRQITNPYIDQVTLGNAFKAFADEHFACRLFSYTVFNDASSFTGDNSGITGTRLVTLFNLLNAVYKDINSSGKCYDAAGVKKIYKILTSDLAEEKAPPKPVKKKSGAKKQKSGVSANVPYKSSKKPFNYGALIAALVIAICVAYAVKTVNTGVEQRKEEISEISAAAEAAAAELSEDQEASEVPVIVEATFHKFGDEPNAMLVRNASEKTCKIMLLDDKDENVLIFDAPPGLSQVNIPVGTWRVILAFEGRGPEEYGDIVSPWDSKVPVEIEIG